MIDVDVEFTSNGEKITFYSDVAYDSTEFDFYTVTITKYGDASGTSITLNVPFVINNTNVKTCEIVPNQIGQSDTTFDDGIYTFYFKQHNNDASIYDTRYIYKIKYTSLGQCLKGHIAEIAKIYTEGCDCLSENELESNVNKVMRFKLLEESILASVTCGKLAEANAKYEDLVEACAAFDCGC